MTEERERYGANGRVEEPEYSFLQVYVCYAKNNTAAVKGGHLCGGYGV